MKNIIKLLSFTLLVSLTIVSCDEDETTYNPLSFPSDAFVALVGSSGADLESATTPIEIVLNRSTSTDGATADLSVDFTITSDNAVLGTHYTIIDNKSSFSFAPGVFQDTLQILPIDNAIEDGNKSLSVTLGAASSDINVGLPGPDANGTTYSVTIQDDDCAFTLQELGDAAFSGTDDVPSGQEGPNSSQITTSFDGTNLLIEGIGYGWITGSYWNEPVIDSNKLIASVDLVNGNITIAQQYLCETTYLGVPQALYSLEGSGVYTSCSKTMVINYDIIQNGGVLRSFSETITF